MSLPRILIAGLRGSSGKTIISTGLVAVWRQAGLRVAPFKKGPDYIDAAWLSAAAGQPCRNLDLFLMQPGTIWASFAAGAEGSDVALIEGNRGLYDGMDVEGTCSTAELAKLLKAPIVLAVECTKSTRTVAAIVLGCQKMDPDANVKGVILTRTGGCRHERLVQSAIEQTTGLPVLGAIPRLAPGCFPERHLGLLPPQECEEVPRAIKEVARIVEEYVDLDAVRRLAEEAPGLDTGERTVPPATGEPTVRIGIFRDAAFQFYYHENLEALERSGGKLIEISPLHDTALPEVDALYIGGGFPETAARELSDNVRFRESLRARIENGLPVYAECGGAVYLGERLAYEGKDYPMTGVFPVSFGFGSKPQGHGYAEVEATEDNPFYSKGDVVRGHEFHYTYMEQPQPDGLSFGFRIRRGHGFDGQRDGICRLNAMACYTHVHALGVENWAPALIRKAEWFRERGAAKASDRSRNS